MNLEATALPQLRAALDSGEVSAERLARGYLERIAASSLNAFIDVQPELTLAQARAADARLARGERAPLLGVPLLLFLLAAMLPQSASRCLAAS